MLDLMFKSYDFNNSNPLSNDDGSYSIRHFKDYSTETIDNEMKGLPVEFELTIYSNLIRLNQ